MKHTLELDSVLKTFGEYQLLTDIYLKVETGEIIGFFGRNGTGKTVLMKILFGTMKADRKFTRLDGGKKIDKPFTIPGLIAYLPQDHFLPKHLTIDQAARLYLNEANYNLFFEEDETASWNRDTEATYLSNGERRYLEIKLLLLSKHKFLILDEPFNFLAPVLMEKVILLIRKHASGKGIIITDHHFKNVLQVANRILLLKEGVLKELTDKRGLIEQEYIRSLE